MRRDSGGGKLVRPGVFEATISSSIALTLGFSGIENLYSAHRQFLA
jgi:hypothetical protein